MSGRQRMMAFAVAPVAAILAGLGLGAHRWGVAHVEYYTGDVARTTNCVACHVEARGGTIPDRLLRPRYRTPLDIAVCRDGRLFVTAQDSDALLGVDPVRRRVVSEIAVGRRPHGVALAPDCSRAYVSNERSNSISVVDLAKGKTVAALPTGDAPMGVALGARDGRLFVANWFGGDISVLDLAHGVEQTRLVGASNPNALAVSPDGTVLLVTNELSRASRYPDPPVSEVTVVDPARMRVVSRVELPNAHLLEGVAFAPEGDLALVASVRPKNLIPALQVERGWMMTNGLAVIDLRRGRSTQVPLDDLDAFYADPSDVAVTPDGRYAFVSHGGVDKVTVVDLPALRQVLEESTPEQLSSLANRLGISSRYVRRRIPVGANPQGLAVSPDGRFVYVAERLDDRIGVIDVARLEKVGGIDLGGPGHLTVRRRGERLFHSARVTLEHQFSCRSCHPNSHMDRLQYDFEPDGLGRGIVDNRTLLGIRDTGPFKWNGKNTSLYMQCGIRFARFLTRSEPFPPEELNELVAYISSLEPLGVPGSGEGALTPAQRRGKEIFERTRTRQGAPIPENDRCITCHPPPHYTDRLKRDVGTTSPWDQSPWETTRGFDTPQLNNLGISAPYLHDGRAVTLEEIWTLYNPDEKHGVTNDLGKSGLNDLVEYLRTL